MPFRPKMNRTHHQRWRENKTVFERNKFFASTTLAGFGFIQKSTSRAEIILWYVVIGLVVVVAFANIGDLIAQYASDHTVTTVSMGKLNATYDWKPFNLRLRVSLPELNREYMASRRWETQHFVQPSQMSLSEEITVALQKLTTREEWFTKQWDYALLPLLSRYASHQATCEYSNVFCIPQFYDYTEFELMTGAELKPAREQLLKVLNQTRNLEISDRELFQALGEQVRTLTQLQPVDQDVTPLEFELRTVFNGHYTPGVQFSYRVKPLVPVQVGFSGGINILATIRGLVDILHNSGVLGDNSTAESAYEWFAKFKPEMDVEIDENNRKKLSVNLHQTNHWVLQPSSSYISIKSCLKEGHHECGNECTSKVIQEQCGCNPNFVPVTTTGDRQWCRDKDYRACFHDTKENERSIREKCVHACPTDCHVRLLDMELIEQSTEIVDKTHLHISLNILHKDHPVFQESYAQSFASFTAELGGTIDFWLGASVVPILHLIVYMFKQLVYSFHGATKTGQNIRNRTIRADSIAMTDRPSSMRQNQNGSASVTQCIDLLSMHEDIRALKANMEECMSVIGISKKDSFSSCSNGLYRQSSLNPTKSRKLAKRFFSTDD